MTTLTQTLPEDAGFLISEANGHRSRDEITLKQRAALYRAGEVVGQVTADSEFTTYDDGAVDGTEMAAAIVVRDTDASAAAVSAAAVRRDAEVQRSELVFDAGQNQAAQDAAIVDLAVRGIIAR